MKNAVRIKLALVLLCCLMYLILPTRLFASQPILRVCHTVLAPWKMVVDGKPEGPDLEIITAIADRAGLAMKVEICPFARCLISMEQGDVDIMTGLLKSAEREKYIIFIEPAYKRKSNKAFYVRKGHKSLISSYTDLAKLTIGTSIGSNYFPRFDRDNSLKKEWAPSLKNSFLMLSRGRVDTVIATDSAGDYILQEMKLQDSIEKASYTHNHNNPVYLGISKRSQLAGKKDLLVSVTTEMVQNGEVDKIITRFFLNKGLPVPDYK